MAEFQVRWIYLYLGEVDVLRRDGMRIGYLTIPRKDGRESGGLFHTDDYLDAG